MSTLQHQKCFLEQLRLKLGITTKTSLAKALGWSRQRYQHACLRDGPSYPIKALDATKAIAEASNKTESEVRDIVKSLL